jgi:hypothetical protein
LSFRPPVRQAQQAVLGFRPLDLRSGKLSQAQAWVFRGRQLLALRAQRAYHLLARRKVPLFVELKAVDLSVGLVGSEQRSLAALVFGRGLRYWQL